MPSSTMCAVYVMLRFFASHAATCDMEDVTCGAAHAQPRSGSAMIQTRSQQSHGSAQRDGPEDQQGVQMTTRMTQMELSVTKLEQVSGEGREELKKNLEALQQLVATTKAGGTGSLADTVSRITASEAQLATLEGTADTGHQEVRAEIEALRTRLDSLSKSVGERVSSPSLLQSPTAQEPAAADAAAAPAAAAPAAPIAAAAPAPPAAGGSMMGRCSALETRVDALEAASDQERDTIKTDLDALVAEVDALRTGGAGSLDHTIARASSAEKQISSLQNTNDEQSMDLRSELEALEAKIKGLSKRVGLEAAMIQMQAKRDSPTALPLTSRMASLQKRIEQLESKSGQGRADLQTRLASLSEAVDHLRGVGAESLEHTTLRTGSAETAITALDGTIAQDKASLATYAEELKAKLATLEASVGMSS